MPIYSFSPFGYDGSLVQIEVDLRKGVPAVDIVGLADGAVKESRERMRSAILNSGFEFPSERVLISLSPADLKKEGTGFDLAVALAVLSADMDIPNVLAMGELALNGEVRSVRGTYAALQSAVEGGIEYALVPNSANPSIPEGVKVIHVGSLKDAFEVLQDIKGERWTDKKEIRFPTAVEFPEVSEEESLDNLKGHNEVKYTMAVAAAGRHNMLVYGAPGCGKSLCMQRMPQLLPLLSAEEMRSVDRIRSIAGFGPNVGKRERPFRMPHQIATLEGMCGGGISVMPGEISLAHNGVLFLDEAAEFKSSVIQMMRVPLESNQICLSRAGRSTVYPANFQLLMAMNPCPCGNFGHEHRVCLCSKRSVELYWRKISKPLLDRVEIKLDMAEKDTATELTLEELREMIKGAWEVQLKRQGKLNGDLNADEVASLSFDEKAERHLVRYAEEKPLNPREVANIKKLARTLQDMHDPKETVDDIALSRALQLNGKIPVEL